MKCTVVGWNKKSSFLHEEESGADVVLNLWDRVRKGLHDITPSVEPWERIEETKNNLDRKVVHMYYRV